MSERSEGPSSKPSSCRSWSMQTPVNNFLGLLKHKVEKFNKTMDKLFSQHFNGLLSPPDVVHHAFPVPTPSATTTTNYAVPYADQQGWQHLSTTSAGLHEASGSNPTSEYFDAVDPSEYTAQHRNPALHVRPSFLLDTESSMSGSMYTQLAGSFDELLLGTPTSHRDRADQPFPNELFPTVTDDDHPVVNELFFSGELFPAATSTEQHPGPQQHPQSCCQVTTDDHASHAITTSQQHWHGSMGTIITGDTVESTMDSMISTPTSHDDPNHLRSRDEPFSEPFPIMSVNGPVNGPVNSPVNEYFSGELVFNAMKEQHPGQQHPRSWQATDDATTSIQQDTHHMTGGSGKDHSMMHTGASNWISPYIRSPVPTEPPTSARRTFYNHYVELRRILNGEEFPGGSGRRGRGVRVATRIFCIAMRLKGKSVRLRKRTREPCQRRGQCMKTTRVDAESRSAASVLRGANKGVKQRNGKWFIEVRVSQTTDVKVWMGMLASEKEAALAHDACSHHCSERTKEKHFPELVPYLGPSQYQKVLALCRDDHKEQAQALVKMLAETHAAAFGHIPAVHTLYDS